MKVFGIIFRYGSEVKAIINTNIQVTVGAITYEPVKIDLGALELSELEDRDEFSFKCQRKFVQFLSDYAIHFFGNKFDVEVKLVDPYAATEEDLFRGVVSEVTADDLDVSVSVLAETAERALSVVGHVATPNCTLRLFSTRCALSRADYFVSGVVSWIDTNKKELTITLAGKGIQVPDPWYSTTDWFKYGFAKVADRGEARMIVSQDNSGKITLFWPFISVEVGDGIVFYAGCDKKIDTCKNKFSNADNFIGFPWAPYEDQVFVGRESYMKEGKKK